MGVIRKKTITRGGEGGVKYVCDVCSSDITSTVSFYIMCAVFKFHAFAVAGITTGLGADMCW
jgi:hypothetical protein